MLILTVFTHELVKVHVVRVHPPLLPLVGVRGSDRRIPDRSIELVIDQLSLRICCLPSRTHPDV